MCGHCHRAYPARSRTNLIISCSFCSSCFCLCTTDSMISRSSGVRCDRSGISAAILSTQHQHTALRSATTRHNDGAAMCVVPCAGTAVVMVSPWTRHARPDRGHRAAGYDGKAAATPTSWPRRRGHGDGGATVTTARVHSTLWGTGTYAPAGPPARDDDRSGNRVAVPCPSNGDAGTG